MKLGHLCLCRPRIESRVGRLAIVLKGNVTSHRSEVDHLDCFFKTIHRSCIIFSGVDRLAAVSNFCIHERQTDIIVLNGVKDAARCAFRTNGNFIKVDFDLPFGFVDGHLTRGGFGKVVVVDLQFSESCGERRRWSQIVQ